MRKKSRLRSLQKIFTPLPFVPSSYDTERAALHMMYRRSYKQRFTRDADVEALFEFLALQGAKAFGEDWVQEAVTKWRMILTGTHSGPWPIKKAVKVLGPPTGPLRFRVISPKQPVMGTSEDLRHARRNLRRIGEALANVAGAGRPPLTESERTQKRRLSNLTVQRDRRASFYCERAWERYLKEKERAKATDALTLSKIARDIAREERSHGGEAKQEGVRLFLQKVKRTLPE